MHRVNRSCNKIAGGGRQADYIPSVSFPLARICSYVYGYFRSIIHDLALETSIGHISEKFVETWVHTEEGKSLKLESLVCDLNVCDRLLICRERDIVNVMKSTTI
jgi:hypothetical protein